MTPATYVAEAGNRRESPCSCEGSFPQCRAMSGVWWLDLYLPTTQVAGYTCEEVFFFF